jgi:polysaccharide transporter, PST family
VSRPAAVLTDRPEARIVSNTLVQFVPPGVRMGLGLILAGTLSRYLGPRQFGEYALVFAYVATFSGIFNDWGLGTVCLRELSRRPAERARLASSAASLQAAIALATYVLMVASLAVLRYPTPVKQAITIYGLSLLLLPLDVLALPFQADLRMARLVAPALTGNLLIFALSMSVVLLHGPLLALVLASLIGVVTQYAWISWLSLRLLGFAPRPTTAGWRLLGSEAWPLGLSTIVSTALQQGPLLALSFFSVEAVGLFNAANKIPQQLFIVPLAVRATTFPLISQSWVQDRPRFTRQLALLIKGSLLLSIPIAIFGAGIAGPAIGLIFGNPFAGAAVPFTLLLITFAFMFPGILVGEALIAAGFQRLNLAVLAGSVPLLILLCVLLVPRGGATGAALAALLAYAAIVTANLVLARRRLGRVVSGETLLKSGLAAGAGTLTLIVAGPLPHLASASLAALVAAACLARLDPTLLGQLKRLRAFS